MIERGSPKRRMANPNKIDSVINSSSGDMTDLLLRIRARSFLFYAYFNKAEAAVPYGITPILGAGFSERVLDMGRMRRIPWGVSPTWRVMKEEDMESKCSGVGSGAFLWLSWMDQRDQRSMVSDNPSCAADCQRRHQQAGQNCREGEPG